MKTTLKSIAVRIGLTAVLGSAALFAQTKSIANIPFDFQIPGATLPAGQYSVQLEGSNHVLTFRNLANGHPVMLLTHAYNSETPQESKLTFRCEGERCTMETVWFAGVQGGYGPLHKRNRADGERGIVATVRLLNK